MVGANDGLPYTAQHGQQQVQRQSDGRQRVGLMPTEGRDAYKRSSMRASKRSRADRLSYLVATGHMNKDEAQELCAPLDDSDCGGVSGNENNNNSTIPHFHLLQQPHLSNQLTNSNQLPSSSNSNSNMMTTPMMIMVANNPQGIIGDQALLDYVSSASETPDNFKINSNKIKKNLKVRMPTDNRGQFRRTRTEVTLPMKTSPAFEYILKDKGRRNRRCFLWFIYSTLMTIGLTVLVFCSIQLVMRHKWNS